MFTFDCTALQEPILKIQNAISLSLNAECKISIWKKFSFDLKTTIDSKIKETIDKNKIFFYIRTFKVTSLYLKMGKTDRSLNFIKWLGNFLFKGIVRQISENIGKKGIALPSVKGLDYSKTYEVPKEGYLEIATSPKIDLKQLQ